MGFWDDFTGKSARRDLQSANQNAMLSLDAGSQQARGELGQGYETARGDLDPYIESGQQGQKLYADLMGLNGPEAQAAAQATYSQDQGMMGQLGQEQNAMLRNMNARGLSGSGAGALAGARVAAQGYDRYLNRAQGMSQAGQQAAGQGAQLAYGYGNDQANLSYGTAQQKAGLHTGMGNAMAASRNTLTNNLLGVAGVAAKAYTGYSQPGARRV